MVLRLVFMTIDFWIVSLSTLSLLFLSTVSLANGNDVNGCYKEDSSERTYTHDGLECALCPPGYIMREHCTSFMPSSCTQCQGESYMPHFNKCPNCLLCDGPCIGLNQILVQECNSTHPRVCGCLEGTYPSTDKTACFKLHGSCPPGQRVHIRITGRTKIPCRNCPPNTYSSRPNKRTRCLPRRNCTAEGQDFVWLGNSTHDAVCKNSSLVTDDIRATSEANMTTEKPDVTTHPQGISTSDQGKETRPPATINSKNKTHESKTSDHKKDSYDWQIIGGAVGVTLGAIALIVLVACLIYCCCCCRNTQKKKPKYGISKKAKKAYRAALCQEIDSSESDEDVRLTVRNRTISRQISSCTELLQRTITLKQGKSPEDFFLGIATKSRRRYWKLLLRNLPSPALTEPEIDDIEYRCDRDGLHEVVYQCLLKWNQKQTGDSFPVKDILEALFHHDKPLVSALIKEYCDCEQLAR